MARKMNFTLGQSLNVHLNLRHCCKEKHLSVITFCLLYVKCCTNLNIWPMFV